MEMGKHYKADHVCLRARFLSPRFIIEDISFMHLSHKYFLGLSYLSDKVTKA